MALQKKIDFQNGIVAEKAYLEISTINLDYTNKTCNFTLKTYLSKETKESGLNPITNPDYFNISDNKIAPVGITQTEPEELTFTKYFLVGDAKLNAEKYIKTMDKYKDCIEVE